MHFFLNYCTFLPMFRMEPITKCTILVYLILMLHTINNKSNDSLSHSWLGDTVGTFHLLTPMYIISLEQNVKDGTFIFVINGTRRINIWAGRGHSSFVVSLTYFRKSNLNRFWAVVDGYGSPGSVSFYDSTVYLSVKFAKGRRDSRFFKQLKETSALGVCLPTSRWRI